MTSPLKIYNRDARRLWLETNLLAQTPTGSLDLASIVRNLGFVQLDTIQVVARAHHHILWSRNQNYREPMLNKLLSEDRGIFEHFTHDASVIPIETYPIWQRQFKRLEAKVRKWEWHKGMLDANGQNLIKERIRDEGSLCTKAFDTKIVGTKKMWSRPPHKLALDYMWYAGELSTSHREAFTKFYDLTERVIPKYIRDIKVADADQIDRLCEAALDRLGFGTVGDIQRFWGAASNTEVKTWCQSRNDLVPVLIEGADKVWRDALAFRNIEQRLGAAPAPTSRLRILNPFDPAIRDRARLQRLFGFDYTVEMFVPAAKRVWGYYVYPILEGDKFVGRIEVKADRKTGQLNVISLWAERGVRWTRNRSNKLNAELERLARFVGIEDIHWMTSTEPAYKG